MGCERKSLFGLPRKLKISLPNPERKHRTQVGIVHRMCTLLRVSKKRILMFLSNSFIHKPHNSPPHRLRTPGVITHSLKQIHRSVALTADLRDYVPVPRPPELPPTETWHHRNPHTQPYRIFYSHEETSFQLEAKSKPNDTALQWKAAQIRKRKGIICKRANAVLREKWSTYLT